LFSCSVFVIKPQYQSRAGFFLADFAKRFNPLLEWTFVVAETSLGLTGAVLPCSYLLIIGEP